MNLKQASFWDVLLSGFFCALLVLNGCVHREDSSGFSTPVNLAHQITDADHIVMTNRFSHLDPQIQGFTVSISGTKVSTIVKAISHARRLENGTLSVWDWQILFYKGTNYLANVNFQDSVFLAENGEYIDDTGVLANLYKNFEQDDAP